MLNIFAKNVSASLFKSVLPLFDLDLNMYLKIERYMIISSNCFGDLRVIKYIINDVNLSPSTEHNEKAVLDRDDQKQA